MPSIDLLLKSLQAEYPHLSFHEGEYFSWAPSTKTISFNLSEPSGAERLLHEVAHAELGHKGYERDIDLVAMERDAWQLARTKHSQHYDIPITSTVVEAHMDTYRDWLHSRSTCPHCTATGLQIGKKTYKCLACLKAWDVNEARVCALRRYKK